MRTQRLAVAVLGVLFATHASATCLAPWQGPKAGEAWWVTMPPYTTAFAVRILKNDRGTYPGCQGLRFYRLGVTPIAVQCWDNRWAFWAKEKGCFVSKRTRHPAASEGLGYTNLEQWTHEKAKELE